MRRPAQPLPIQRMDRGRRQQRGRVPVVVWTLLVGLLVAGGVAAWQAWNARSAEVNVSVQPSTRTAPINHAGVVAARDRQRSELVEGHSTVAIELSPSLRLRMIRDSWVEVFDAQGERLEYNLLRAGVTHDFDGQAPFSVLLSQGLAADIWLYGQRVEFEAPPTSGLLRLQIGDEQPVSNAR